MFESSERGELYQAASLYQIKGADLLLSGKDYVEKIEMLRNYNIVDKQLFEQYYWHLLANLADYIQMLPDPREKNLPIFHVALARAKMAFEEVLKHKDQRFQYAYISLAMFADLGVCLVDYEVLICDSDGAVLDDWHPISRGLSDYVGYFYKVRPINLYPKKLRFDVNPVLACKIMPESGLTFLKEDPRLFSQWLRALSGKDDAGELSAVLDASQAFPRSSVIINLDSAIIATDSYANAEAFWLWLLEQIKQDANYEIISGKILVNLDDLLKDYAKKNNQDYQALKRSLNKIKVFGKEGKFKNKFLGKNKSFSSSMFGSAGVSTKQGSYIERSVLVSKEQYIKQKGSMLESSKRHKGSLMLEENKNQQMS